MLKNYFGACRSRCIAASLKSDSFECPDMLFGLQRRLDESALPALSGLQVGTSAGILARVDGDRFVGFTAVGTLLPKEIRSAPEPITRLFASARRLGAWFAAEDPAPLIAKWIPIEL
jgi:hypothetical protein